MGCSWGGFWGAHRMPAAASAGATRVPGGESDRGGPRRRGAEGEVRRDAQGTSARDVGVASRAAPASGEGRPSFCAAARSAARSASRRSSMVKAEVLAERSCLLILMR